MQCFLIAVRVLAVGYAETELGDGNRRQPDVTDLVVRDPGENRLGPRFDEVDAYVGVEQQLHSNDRSLSCCSAG